MYIDERKKNTGDNYYGKIKNCPTFQLIQLSFQYLLYQSNY